MIALTGDRPDLAGDVGILGASDEVQAAVSWYGPGNLLSTTLHPAFGLGR